MDASVSMKMTPQEFDDLREAVDVARLAALAEYHDASQAGETRREARERSDRLADLLERLV